jgi:hypothetical protein
MKLEVEQAATEWLTKHRATKDPETLAKIVKRAQELVAELGGFIAPAHFERAYLELVTEGEIEAFRGNMQEKIEEPDIPREIETFITTASAFQLQRAYKNDPTFARYYDVWAARSKKSGQPSSAPLVVTVEEYTRTPAAVIAARYQREAAYRSAIDKLVDEAKI